MSICGTWFQIIDVTLLAHRIHAPYLRMRLRRLIHGGTPPQTYFFATLFPQTGCFGERRRRSSETC